MWTGNMLMQASPNNSCKHAVLQGRFAWAPSVQHLASTSVPRFASSCRSFATSKSSRVWALAVLSSTLACYQGVASRSQRGLKIGDAGSAWAGWRGRVARRSASSESSLPSGGKQTPPEYPGPKADAQFVQELADFLSSGALWQWADAQRLVRDALQLLQTERTLEYIDVAPGGHLTVVGDVHGQYFDVLAIFKEHGLPGPDNPYIFNGDFVDRGSYSIETLLLLLAWKVACPQYVHLARGNHEAHEMNVPYGFFGETFTKYGAEAYITFQDVFSALPLAHVVNKAVLVVHGGLPRSEQVNLAAIEAVDRVKAGETREDIFTDLMWCDPCNQAGINRSKRGPGVVTFCPDVTERFLNENNLQLLIRSHEVKDEGFEWTHNNQCLTVFSAPNYADACDNKGAVVRLTVPTDGGAPQPELRPFDAAPRPSFYIPAMAYSPYSPESRRFLSLEAKKQLQALLR